MPDMPPYTPAQPPNTPQPQAPKQPTGAELEERHRQLADENRERVEKLAGQP